MQHSYQLIPDPNIAPVVPTSEPILPTSNNEGNKHLVVLMHAVEMLCEKLPVTAELVEKNTTDISTRFVKMAGDAHKQSDQIKEITELSQSIPYGNQRISMDEFSHEFTTTLNSCIDRILFISKKSIAMVYELERAMESLQAIGGYIKDIQRINKQANLLALNAAVEASKAGAAGKSFAVVADEVKQVSYQIRDFSCDIATRIARVTMSVQSGYGLVEEMAGEDLTENITAQVKLNTLLASLNAQNKQFKHILSDAADVSKTMADKIQSTVVNMQFQDRNSQYIQNSVIILKLLSDTLGEATGEEADAKLSVDDESLKKISDKLLLSEFRQGLFARATGTKESDMPAVKEDDVELF